MAEVAELSSLRILADTSSLELFVNGGEQVMTTRYYPSGAQTLRIGGQGEATLYDMDAMELAYTAK